MIFAHLLGATQPLRSWNQIGHCQPISSSTLIFVQYFLLITETTRNPNSQNMESSKECSAI